MTDETNAANAVENAASAGANGVVETANGVGNTAIAPATPAPAKRLPPDRNGDGAPGGSDALEYPFLTTRPSDDFGAEGRFVDLKLADAEAYGVAEDLEAAAESGALLVHPTAEQLSRRRPAPAEEPAPPATKPAGEKKKKKS